MSNGTNINSVGPILLKFEKTYHTNIGHRDKVSWRGVVSDRLAK